MSFNNFRTNIRLGEWDLSSEQDCVERDEGYEECADIPVDIEPEEIMYHSKFNYEELQHDIALIRLTKPAPLTGIYTFYISHLLL